MPGIGIGVGLGLGGGGGGLSEAGVARAVAAAGLSDAQARAAVGGAASLAAGLRAVGLLGPAPAPSVPASPAPAAPAGFALNGSGNARLRAMLARVKAGTGRGRLVAVGDSTFVGDGGGVGGSRIAGARANRPTAALAAALAAAGWPALDNSVYTGNTAPSGAGPAQYDPRLALGGWVANDPAAAPVYAEFAGGGFFSGAAGAAPLTATVAGVDTFEVQVYATDSFAMTFRIDGAAPAGGPAGQGFASTGGTTRVVVKAAAAGTRTLALAASAGQAVVRSILAYDSAAPAVDILCAAGCGLTSAQLAATAANATRSLDQLRQDAPDAVILFADFNDMNQHVAPAAHAANLGAIVDAAGASGDVLLVGGWRGASASFDDAATRAATAQVAAAKGVAFIDLDAFYGHAVPPMMYDEVHRTPAGYAELGDVYRRCLLAMAA